MPYIQTISASVGSDDNTEDSCGLREYNYLKNISTESENFDVLTEGATNFPTKGLLHAYIFQGRSEASEVGGG